MKKEYLGFTLLELLIVVIITAILATAAAPGLTSTFQTNRLSAQANDLISGLILARSEAMRRNSPAIVCMSSDHKECNGSDWSQGWLVYADIGTIADTLDSGDEIVLVHEALPGNITVTTTLPNNSVRYSSTGLSTTPGCISMSVSDDLPKKTVNIGSTGKVSLSVNSCS